MVLWCCWREKGSEVAVSAGTTFETRPDWEWGQLRQRQEMVTTSV